MWIVPRMVCVHLLDLAGHLEIIGGELYSLQKSSEKMTRPHVVQQAARECPIWMPLLAPDWVWGNTVITCTCQPQPRFVRVSQPPVFADFSKGTVECCNCLHSPALAREKRITMPIRLSGLSKTVGRCQDHLPSPSKWSSRMMPHTSTSSSASSISGEHTNGMCQYFHPQRELRLPSTSWVDAPRQANESPSPIV